MVEDTTNGQGHNRWLQKENFVLADLETDDRLQKSIRGIANMPDSQNAAEVVDNLLPQIEIEHRNRVANQPPGQSITLEDVINGEREWLANNKAKTPRFGWATSWLLET